MRKVQTFILLLLCALSAWGQREDILMNNQWLFRFSHQVQSGTERRIDLPHTWNAQDALSGKIDYKRGLGNYEKKMFIKESWKGKRLFLRFEGANSVTNVFVNYRHVGEHRGGYGAFIFEITDFVNYGKDNSIVVRVNNGEQLDVMPLVGDFNFYGGIYRDVHLLITDETCISPLDYASSGVYLTQKSVNRQLAQIQTKVMLSNASANAKEMKLRLTVLAPADNRMPKLTPSDVEWDYIDHATAWANSKVIAEQDKKIAMQPVSDQMEQLDFSIANPHLWNGQADPFMYRVSVAIYDGDKMVDEVIQPLGVRYCEVKPDSGFYLNGKHLALHGVCRHQERPEIGNAVRLTHHEEDVALMLEMGVNATRLAHYPQAEQMYDLMDKYGFVTWAEIPFVGSGGYVDKGFVNQRSFRDNGKEQLKELIRQNYNHPSICFWGMFNELSNYGESPIPYINELNDLAHHEDSIRPTTSASNQGGDINFITDLHAWNRYDGWYGSTPATLATFLDATHKEHPSMCIAISEYGAGASIYQQQDSLKQSVPTSWWHPENWQTYYHMANWKILSQRPFVWGTFVWNMFDFGAAHRTEGDRPGINDKGLVTFDRKTRKDAFFFYKANWNNREPMIHLAEKRVTDRYQQQQHFMAFTNLPEVELWINGKSYGKMKPDELSTAKWENISLPVGINKIKVNGTGKNKGLKDETTVVQH